MKHFHFYLLLASSLLLSHSSAFSQTDGEHKLFSPKEQPKRLSAAFSFTEGPAVDAKGNVFFTDQPNNRIMRWNSKKGTISNYLEPAGRANGLFFDPAGNLYACADAKNELWKISPDKTVQVLIKDFRGKKLNGPNDLWIDTKGGIYFTDPFYQRKYWTRSEKEIPEERVYYFAPDSTLRIAASDFERPNGIIGTADGSLLYVADIKAQKTYRFQIQADGSLSNRQLHCEMGSDGMTLDSEGNLYLTGDGVTVFSPEGEQIAHIPIPENWTANVTFGGKNRKTLFITAMGSVYALKMKVKGQR
ncbi:MAG TPA: SMP-30/gluconolactonase/LRE family protein [Saprospiraceae bacterium]|nr:SMP-30/gluconolactonase/LRE family protein [Saprospiraceae bacterium]